jgi:hypothetical protein
MEKERFQNAVGEKFRLCSGNSIIELELIDFRELQPRRVRGLRAKPFALIFRGSAVGSHTQSLPRQVHELQDGTGDSISIYLEPIVSTGEDGMLYEAIFD